MGGVQNDQPHPIQHPLLHARYDIVAHFCMSHVSPPGQHIGIGQHCVGETVLGFIQCRYTHLDSLRTEVVGNGCMQAVRIDVANFFMRLFVSIFVPDCHFDGHRLLTFHWRSLICCTCPDRVPELCHSQSHFGGRGVGDAS